MRSEVGRGILHAMKCPFCHVENDAGALVCSNCGKPLADVSDAETLASGVLGSTHASRNTPLQTTGVSSSKSASRSAQAGFPLALEPGDNLGPRYQIEALLGKGGMGLVYKARDLELGRTVALKLVRPDLIADERAMQRFKQELLLSSKISHKNILRIHDLAEVDGLKLISMAYVEGEDLYHLLQREGRLPVEKAVDLARQLCAALGAAHSEGVVHRDLKPHNVMIDREGNALVADFGLAKSLEPGSAEMTQTGQLLGTPRYMSPEQVQGRPVDARTDIYALGLILYEAVTGDIPFNSESFSQMMLARIKGKARNPRELNPDIPDYFARIILRCLEPDPNRRYASAREILLDLDSAHASRSSHSVQLNFAVPEKRGWLYAGAAVIAIAIIAFAIFELRKPSPSHPAAVSTVAGIPSLAKGKFLAVLPFRIIGNRHSIGYLAEGLDEALSAKLFGISGVHIASPSTVEQANSKGSLRAVARDLGVNLVVHGTIEAVGRQIAVVVHLENVATGQLMWAEQFTGAPGDLLTLEDKISGKLMSALSLHPGAAEMAHAVAHPTDNVEAYNLYLRGKEALRGLPDVATIHKAVAMYQGALKQDPGFAAAYAGLANASLQMYDKQKDRVWVQQALTAAQQAQQLNSNLPEVYIALGNVYSATGKEAEAIDVLKRAIKLAPNSDQAYRRLGKAYETGGKMELAIAAFKKAVEIDPYFWLNANELGGAYGRAGKFGEAEKEFNRVIQLAPDNDAGYGNLGTLKLIKYNYEAAIPLYKKALAINPSVNYYSNLGVAQFYSRHYGDAVKMFQKAVESSPNQESYEGNLAEAYFFLGKKAKAKATFNKAIALCYKELQVNSRNANTMADLAEYLAFQGQQEQALQFIRNALSINASNAQYVYDEAQIYAMAGKPDAALKSLRQAFSHGIPYQQAAADPELASLRNHPQFQQLVKKFAAKKN